MSICTRVIVTVSFHKIDCTPDSKTCSKCDYKCLQCSYCALKKCHNINPPYSFLIDKGPEHSALTRVSAQTSTFPDYRICCLLFSFFCVILPRCLLEKTGK